MKNGIITALIIVIVLILIISWAATCGLVKLITLCFGWKFSLLMATGIWLVMFLLRDVFGGNNNVPSR